MFLQILPGRSLPMWMPEPQSGAREDRLRVRRCLQVRSCLHLQALVNNSNRAAYCTLKNGSTGRGPLRGRTVKKEGRSSLES